MNTPWLTTEEAAAYAKMNREVLTRLARLGKIRAGSDGRKWRFRTDWIDAYFMMNGKAK